MKLQYYVVHPKMTATMIIDLEPKPLTLPELQALVGGYIQVIELPDLSQLVVNEEGLLLNLKYNPWASSLTQGAHKLVGNIVHLPRGLRLE